MKTKIFASAVSAVALSACLLGAAGCSTNPDANDLKGVWAVDGIKPAVTVVFTGDEWKLATGITYSYSVNSKDKTITYTVDGMSGTSTYEFSSDRKTLTLTEDNGEGETKTTVFDKVSDDTTEEPSVGD